MENPYNKNNTMRMLGYQCPAEIMTHEAHEQMGDIFSARPYTTTFDTALDMFMLGYIHGKRAERARKERNA